MQHVKFNNQKNYNDFVYYAGKVYGFTRPDLVNRWVKRGCTVLDNYKGDLTEHPFSGEIEAPTGPVKVIKKKDSKKSTKKKKDTPKVAEKPEKEKEVEIKEEVSPVPTEEKVGGVLDIINENAEQYLEEEKALEEAEKSVEL